jgi:hypothetical protein
MGSRLVCPQGEFKGLFFSEELLFALRNGYTLLELGNFKEELILSKD